MNEKDEVWNEFNGNWEELAWKSEIILAGYKGDSIGSDTEGEFQSNVQGKERDSIVKVRVSQSFFRKMILVSYNNTCCITDINVSEFLVAIHIISWSIDSKNRVNRGNGLCLNSLHDTAFDKGYISISTDFKILVSQELKKEKRQNCF